MHDAYRSSAPDPPAAGQRAPSQRHKSGALRVFLGYAPGVGKTHAMLTSALRLRGHGLDVVVGAIETCGSPETAGLLGGLEIIPSRMVTNGDAPLEELDLDAALARRPGLILLDDLAHTNPPGSRHRRRWQDVAELQGAGIDVYTTLNVHHIESLNDVVAQITTVRVRDTVPDAVLEGADAIHLVDLPPDQLLERLREGKVRVEAAHATGTLLQRGNLLALREIALRRAAERVDAELHAYREELGVKASWAAGERILVCVGPAPTSARLVRAACRMATALRAHWTAAYVESTASPTMSRADRGRLEGHLRLAESLGGEVIRLTGDRKAPALLAYARKHDVTRIVLGKPTHPRLRDLLRGSLMEEVVRGSGHIDVHAISGDADAAPDPEPPAPTEHAPARHYLTSALLVAAASGLAFLGRGTLIQADVAMIFLLVIMLAAVRYGRGPSLVAAALSVASFDFFFIPPLYTFEVVDVRHVITFATMFVVGALLSGLTLRLRRQEHEARLREERTRGLYTLSRALGSALDEGEAAQVAATHVERAFGGAATTLLPDGEGVPVPSGREGAGLDLDTRDLGAARWAFANGQPAGLGTDTLPEASIVAIPLQAAAEVVGVLAFRPHRGEHLTNEQRRLLEAFVRPVALALARSRLDREAKAAAVRASAEEMRSSLLSSVSHDLRTPLAAITGAATTLRDAPVPLSAEQRRELLETICDEAERQERLVANLLDMTRLEASAVAPRCEWVPLVELVGSALTRLDEKLTGRPVTIDLQADLPLVCVDPVLLEQLVFNLLENAAKHTPSGTAIEVGGRIAGPSLEVVVADRGPGLPSGAGERLFDKFYRGPQVGEPGVGLGLAICRAIAAAHGGTLVALQREGGGAEFRLLVPLIGEPPSVPTDEPVLDPGVPR